MTSLGKQKSSSLPPHWQRKRVGARLRTRVLDEQMVGKAQIPRLVLGGGHARSQAVWRISNVTVTVHDVTHCQAWSRGWNFYGNNKRTGGRRTEYGVSWPQSDVSGWTGGEPLGVTARNRFWRLGIAYAPCPCRQSLATTTWDPERLGSRLCHQSASALIRNIYHMRAWLNKSSKDCAEEPQFVGAVT